MTFNQSMLLIKLSFKNLDWLEFDVNSKQFMNDDKSRVNEQKESIKELGILKSYLSVKLFSKDILEFLYMLLLLLKFELELFPEE